jgi:hypothetical protein
MLPPAGPEKKNNHKITQRYIIIQSYYAKEAETHITHYRADTDHVWIEIESLQWILGQSLSIQKNRTTIMVSTKPKIITTPRIF